MPISRIFSSKPLQGIRTSPMVLAASVSIAVSSVLGMPQTLASPLPGNVTGQAVPDSGAVSRTGQAAFPISAIRPTVATFRPVRA
jgi:hypothetical protein